MEMNYKKHFEDASVKIGTLQQELERTKQELNDLKALMEKAEDELPKEENPYAYGKGHVFYYNKGIRICRPIVMKLIAEKEELEKLLNEKECWKEAKANAKQVIKLTTELSSLKALMNKVEAELPKERYCLKHRNNVCNICDKSIKIWNACRNETVPVFMKLIMEKVELDKKLKEAIEFGNRYKKRFDQLNTANNISKEMLQKENTELREACKSALYNIDWQSPKEDEIWKMLKQAVAKMEGRE